MLPPSISFSLGVCHLDSRAFWFIPDLPSYSSPTFCLIGLEGQVDSMLLSRSSLKSTAAQLSQVYAKGQIHRVQPLQPLIKLLKGATAFIKNRDITQCTILSSFSLLRVPHPSCEDGRFNLYVASCTWFIEVLPKKGFIVVTFLHEHMRACGPDRAFAILYGGGWWAVATGGGWLFQMILCIAATAMQLELLSPLILGLHVMWKTPRAGSISSSDDRGFTCQSIFIIPSRFMVYSTKFNFSYVKYFPIAASFKWFALEHSQNIQAQSQDML